MIVWSFILPTPIYFLLCGIAVTGSVALHFFPELDDKLGRVGDWISSKWSQLVNNHTEMPVQELLPIPIDHSLIYRRLREHSTYSSETEEDRSMSEYDESSVRYEQLFAELLDTIELIQPALPFNRVIRNSILLV